VLSGEKLPDNDTLRRDQIRVSSLMTIHPLPNTASAHVTKRELFLQQIFVPAVRGTEQ